MRTPVLLSVTVSMLTAAFVIGCSQAENKYAASEQTVAPAQTAAPHAAAPVASPTTTPFVPNTAVPPASSSKSLPPEGGDRPTVAEVDGYRYSYKKDSEKTVATFEARLLPWDRDIVASAIRDVIARSYGDKVDSAPHIKGTGPERSIRVAGSLHQYVVVPVTEPTGEIRSLIITQLD